jgi:signal peptidase I
MPRRWNSYQEQRNYFRRVRTIIIWIFGFFVFYSLFTGLLFSNRSMESASMEPEIKAGDRFIFSNYTLGRLFKRGNLPFKRGQVVLVDRSAGEKKSAVKIVLDAAVRFCTLQRVSLFSREDTIFIKRIVGLPGDTVAITNFVAKIKPAGENSFDDESALSSDDYTLKLPEVSGIWDDAIPFSASMESVVLKAGECFVLSDDRSNTADSRTWGPIQATAIVGRALLRYWPVTQFGPP